MGEHVQVNGKPDMVLMHFNEKKETDESDPEFVNNAPYEYEKKSRPGKRGRPSKSEGRSSKTKRSRGKSLLYIVHLPR